MSDASVDDRLHRLLADVAAARSLLEQVGEEHWARYLREAEPALAVQRTDGLLRLRRAFGGMGSFNDVLIHPMNGHHVTPRDAAMVNRDLDALRSAIYDDVTAILREIELAD